ncbi:MAG: SWF/SNF helicase family protein, partial [Planctomycetes bacterium]|nr:SWF/SNF helicase family protein [Planctomycetota bacterium]
VDFLREIELFATSDDLFAPVGIPSVTNYLYGIENEFLKAEREARKTGQDASKLLDVEEIRRKMTEDRLFGELVTQVSRKYAQESAKLEGGESVLFPETSIPKAIPYEFSKSMTKLLAELGKAFAKANPLFVLPMYYPLFFSKNPDIDGRDQNRQMQTVALIRTVFLKRFESSTAAFAGSVSDLAIKILVWLDKLAPQVSGGEKRLQTWRKLHQDVLDEVRRMYREGIDDDDTDVDVIEPEFDDLYDDVDAEQVDLDAMVDAAFDDLDQLKRFLEIIIQGDWRSDEKYDNLHRLLTDPTRGLDGVFGPEFVNQKVLIFTEFADTARYLHRRLIDDGIKDVDRLDGSRKSDRLKMIQRFAPFYNKVSAADLPQQKSLRVLVTTDVLAEGVNLQDGTIIVNYDLHWNPVRLIQRIGRVDRRRIPVVEERLLQQFPELRPTRDSIFIRNFLPPKQIEDLLRLQSRVSTKAWRISSTLGIPSGRLLDEDDEFDDVRVFDNFKKQLYGELSPLERLRLKWLELAAADPELEERLSAIPDGVGVSLLRAVDHPLVFGCFQFPEPVPSGDQGSE